MDTCRPRLGNARPGIGNPAIINRMKEYTRWRLPTFQAKVRSWYNEVYRIEASELWEGSINPKFKPFEDRARFSWDLNEGTTYSVDMLPSELVRFTLDDYPELMRRMEDSTVPAPSAYYGTKPQNASPTSPGIARQRR